MSPDTDRSGSALEATSEATGWMVGLGMVTMVLFPFALPGIALTVVAILPLLLLGIPLALVAAVVAAPILAVRGLRRRAESRRAVEADRAAARSGWTDAPHTGVSRSS